MAKITAIKPQRNQKRFNVYLDHQFSFPISAEELVKTKLKVGQEISEREIKKLRKEDIKGKLYDRILRFLSYRPRSEKEIRDYANKKVVPTKSRGSSARSAGTTLNHLGVRGTTKIIDEIVGKLKKQGLIDDWEFARWWIEQRSNFRPRGKMALKIELRQKGVNQELIKEIIDQKVDELSLAQKALAKKRKSFKNLEPFEFRQKTTAWLAKLGFCWETIQEVLAETQKKR